jgi:hypothetical protein
MGLGLGLGLRLRLNGRGRCCSRLGLDVVNLLDARLCFLELELQDAA